MDKSTATDNPAVHPSPAKPAKATDPSPAKPAKATDPSPAKPAAESAVSPEPSTHHPILLYNRWDASAVVVSDLGLRRYLNIRPIIVPRSAGRFGTHSLTRNQMHIAERLINKIQVSGHRGRKHRLSSGRQTGRVQTLNRALVDAFQLIEERKKTNPVQVLVKAVENAALLEEIAAYRLGGMVARKSVTVSPQRRLDVSLRHLSQGIQKSAFHSKKRLHEVIAEELIAAAEGDPKSFAIAERNRIEKEAEGSR